MKTLVFVLCVASAAATIDWNVIIPAESDQEQNSSIPDREGRITNGQLAVPMQFPYQVGLQLYLQGASGWCGGTLISNQWILTAAHCTDSAISIDVHLGAWDRTNRNEEGQMIIRVPSNNIIIHEHWNPVTVQHDISLIKLPYPVAFNAYIQPAKLPKFTGETSSYLGFEAIASGWGRTSDSALQSTNILQWVQVPVIGNDVCGSYFSGSVRSTNICVSTLGAKSTCKGDSGGPLVLADGSNTIIGLTSFGSRLGCEKGWPTVFTRVTSYLLWIFQNSGVINI